MYELEVRYSEAIAREAVQRFFLRRVKQFFDLKFGAAVLVLVAYVGWLLWTGNRSWWVGFLVAVIFLIPVGLMAAYAMHWRNAVGRFQQMKVPTARFTLSETDLTVASELGSATVPWSLISEIWEFPGLWLLLFSKSQFVTLPTETVPASTLAFIRSKVARR